MADIENEWYKELFLTRKEAEEIKIEEQENCKSILEMVHEMMEIDESDMDREEANEKIKEIIKNINIKTTNIDNK